jgi:pantetheine-phosphate adenylyltransferase
VSKTALLPGTFDPPTLGHMDLIRRASTICDFLIVGIAYNLEKKDDLFNPNERKAMLQELTKEIENLQVTTFNGLVVDFAKDHNIRYLVRGLRAFSDFEYEFRMAVANRKMTGIETIFLMADENHFSISASLIKEIGGFGRRLNGFVPDEIEEIVHQRLTKDEEI